MAARSKVTGVAETRRAMRELARLVAAPLNQAGKRALEVTLAVAKENAPEDEGKLKKALIVKRKKDSPKTAPVYLLGLKPGSTRTSAAVVTEFGRAPNEDGSGEIRGTHWMGNAFRDTKDEVIRVWSATFGPALEASAKRIAARKK
jgi:hypothetical protein